MEKPTNWGRITLWAIIAILLGVIISLSDKPPNIPTPKSMIPPKPDTDVPMYYDFSNEEWKKVFRGTPRANDYKRSGMSEEELKRYLEKTVPGYHKRTYWGAEFDLNNDDPNKD